MNRRNRTTLVLLVAIGLAALATYGVFRTVKSIPVRRGRSRDQTCRRRGGRICRSARGSRDEQVKVVGWPAATPIDGSFDSLDADRRPGSDCSRWPSTNRLTERKLAPKEAGAGLSPSIPPGMRALSVKVNEVIGVAGFTVPGARVDVVVVLKDRENSMARVVVSNLQVLTSGTKYDIEQAKDGQPMPSTVVTLLVSPRRRRADHARTDGRIHHAGAAQSAGRDPDRDTRRAHGGADGCADDAEPVVQAVQRPRKAAAAAPVTEPATGACEAVLQH